MKKAKAPARPRGYSVKIPDLGLSRSKLSELKKAFENKVVSSLEGQVGRKNIRFPTKTITQKKLQPC